jgi:hypothetical protein
MPASNAKIQIIGQTPGRALFITQTGRCYISRGYEVYRSDNWGATWRLDCRIPSATWKSLASRSMLAARLLRYYIAAFQVLDDGSRVAVARDGLFRAGPNEVEMSRVFTITRGSRPLNLATDGSRLLFGEYGYGLDKLEVFIYISEDRGKTWHVGYRFPAGDICHVHNVINDPWENHYWVLVGDFGRQPGIGALSKDLKTLDWLTRGNQQSRAVRVLIKSDCLLYGTDSDSDRNHIVRLDKKTARIDKLREVEGSSLYATTFGPVNAISTCVEHNPVSQSWECSLYVSWDGAVWHRTEQHKKDWYHLEIFQFGALVLPYAFHDQPRGMYSGQGVVNAHNLVTLLEFENEESKED